MRKLLIIDDEYAIQKVIKTYFEEFGYKVMTASNSAEGSLRLGFRPDIILLDIMMPGTDGYLFCEQIREKITCPIIFLSAKTEEISKIKGFSAGGDDYVTKPFSLPELYARVEAHLRRERRNGEQKQKLYFGELWIDYRRKEIGAGDTPIKLTKKEYGIAELLAMNSGQAFSHEHIYEKIWGYDAEGDANTSVTEHVKRLRKKLNPFETCIETIWGIGYRWKK